ncbi:MAG: bifunctional oligoribonuclease/PAP phosphatase NrnA [Campylobacterota bacterium]|nr:bifunctional oligoribonuclease/PAP phosphatase NrnA [Campylobacterota bacterium]
MLNSYKESLKLIKEAHYILIVTHLNPDADTISSALALSNFMFENKIKHKVFNSSKDIPRGLNFLARFDKITDQIPKFYDLVIYVDCADMQRVGIEIIDDVKIINIDHHQSNNNFGDINIVDSSKASNAEVLYGFFEHNNLQLSKNIASCLYVGIYDDSIAFTTPRTSEDTFRIIKNLVETGISPSDIANNLLRRDSLARYRILPKILETLELHSEGKIATVYLDNNWIVQTGASTNECDDVVNMVLNIAIVECIAYFRVINGKVRVSLRSKNDMDVSNIAKNFNGGGHKNAAGLSVNTNIIEDAKRKVLEVINKNL